MTGPTLDELFDGVQQSAFRWEGRSSYAVGGAEADRIQAWREHRPRPERSVRTNAYLARIARQTLAGASWQRVTLRSDPPTEYQRYRTAGDLESQAAGEQVRVVREAQYTGGWPDFWLLDQYSRDARVAVMRYSDEGAFEGFDLVTGDDVGMYVTRSIELIEASLPLNAYLAGLERTVA